MNSILNLSINDEKISILQITDTHLFSDKDEKLLGIPTFKTFKEVINKIISLQKKYHLVVCSGDISQDQTFSSYMHFVEEVKKLNTPVVWLPGNHDEQSHMNRLMDSLEHDKLLKAKTLLMNDEWMLVLLNSQLKGYPKGMLNKTELDYLTDVLDKYKDKNTLIFIHHNPISCGSTWLDEHKLQNSEALAEILGKHANIKGVICGHIHQEIDGFWQQWPFYSTPSTSIQFLPNSATFSLDINYPGFRELELSNQGNFKTAVTRVKSAYHHIDKEATGY